MAAVKTGATPVYDWNGISVQRIHDTSDAHVHGLKAHAIGVNECPFAVIPLWWGDVADGAATPEVIQFPLELYAAGTTTTPPYIYSKCSVANTPFEALVIWLPNARSNFSTVP